MRGRAVITVGVFAIALGGCGSSGSSAPDVSGGPASDSATLFKAANLSRVLAGVRSHVSPNAQITTIKIEPRDVKVITTTSVVTVDASGKSLTVVTPAIPTIGGPLTLSSISPKVVQQLAAKAAAAARTSLQGVAYLATVPNPIDRTNGWGVYMTDQRHFIASLGGMKFHQAAGTVTSAPGAPNVGTPPASSGGTAAGGGGGTTIDPQKIAACVQKAGTDPQKIAACTGH